MLRYIYILLFLFSVSNGFSQSKKERRILQFINARHNGNIDSVRIYLDDDFRYNHSPYIGLGIKTEISPYGLTVTSLSPFNKSLKRIKQGDIIVEVNGANVKNEDFINDNFIKGSVTDSIKVTLMRGNNTISVYVKLSKNQLKQNKDSFLNDISSYEKKWYEYSLDIIDIFSKKNKYVIYYEWEGSLDKNGTPYSYRCIEIIKTNLSNNKIISIDATWTEKQFRDQFK
tara:strand:+ start:379 stop:1062 length:684 start_codon:yes stop_codon:yes gene_type:complete